MTFDAPAKRNPIDQGKVVGKPIDRVDGPLKTTGRAPYAYERHGVAKNVAYGYLIGSAIACGTIKSFDLDAAKKTPGVLGIVTYENAGTLGTPKNGTVAKTLAGPDVQHYQQTVALVIATTFEQARSAAALVKIDYEARPPRADLAAAIEMAATTQPSTKPKTTGDFDEAYRVAPVTLDRTYATADESHSMMEPFATIASWDAGGLSVWTSNQMIQWTVRDLSAVLGLPTDKVRVDSPFIGGGFGGKLRVRSDVVMAALGSRLVGRPVKVAIQRPLIMNNTGRRQATRQRVRLGADHDGRLMAIAHEAWSGTLRGGRPEEATMQTRTNYAGPHRYIEQRKVVLDLVEGDSMRAPGEAPGHQAFEVAMDELAELLGIDPVELRVINDTQVDPQNPDKPFSSRHFVECLRRGADRFGWSERNAKPAQRREGQWLIGMGVAGAFRNNLQSKSAARVRLEPDGRVVVETDMTDIGTGSYTIITQTAAEMLGVPTERVEARLGDSRFPVSSGSGGQWGANNSTAGVYAACVKLREAIAKKLGLDADAATFVDGEVRANGQALPLSRAAAGGAIEAEDGIEYDRDFYKAEPQCTFGAHFVEVAVHALTGETRIRRMLAVCSAGRILNPKTARSQVIGAQVMGSGAALMEHMAVDTKRGFFANHDLAGYEVPCHADIPHQEVMFLDVTEPRSSPMKAMGVGELGIVGIAAAVNNAVYNATGVRVRDYPITPDKLLDGLSGVA